MDPPLDDDKRPVAEAWLFTPERDDSISSAAVARSPCSSDSDDDDVNDDDLYDGRLCCDDDFEVKGDAAADADEVPNNDALLIDSDSELSNADDGDIDNVFYEIHNSGERKTWKGK